MKKRSSNNENCGITKEIIKVTKVNKNKKK